MATQAERDEANAASERVLTFDTRDEAVAHIDRIAAGWTSIEKPMRSALHATLICIGTPRVSRWAIEVGAQGLLRENGTLEPTYAD